MCLHFGSFYVHIDSYCFEMFIFFLFIYRDRFPFYKSNDDRWKNSVRHNLSINPHFRKGNKAPQGAGHLWIISTRDSEANLLAWEHVRSYFWPCITNKNKRHSNSSNFNFESLHLKCRKSKDWNCFSKWKRLLDKSKKQTKKCNHKPKRIRMKHRLLLQILLQF